MPMPFWPKPFRQASTVLAKFIDEHKARRLDPRRRRYKLGVRNDNGRGESPEQQAHAQAQAREYFSKGER